VSYFLSHRFHCYPPLPLKSIKIIVARALDTAVETDNVIAVAAVAAAVPADTEVALMVVAKFPTTAAAVAALEPAAVAATAAARKKRGIPEVGFLRSCVQMPLVLAHPTSFQEGPAPTAAAADFAPGVGGEEGAEEEGSRKTEATVFAVAVAADVAAASPAAGGRREASVGRCLGRRQWRLTWEAPRGSSAGRPKRLQVPPVDSEGLPGR